VLDLPPPQTLCESRQVFAEIIMFRVENAQTALIKLTYLGYGKDKHHKVLRKALTNYTQKNPLTPAEFGLKIFKECNDEQPKAPSNIE
jgi:hypothetical protein